MEKIEEINVNEKLKKKIEYLEYLNSSLTQKNKLLENKLSNLTKNIIRSKMNYITLNVILIFVNKIYWI